MSLSNILAPNPGFDYDLFANSITLRHGGTGLLVVGPPSAVANADGLDITGDVLTAHYATATSPGIVSVLAQSFAGDKTFENNINLPSTTLTTGTIEFNAQPFIHDFGPGGNCVNIGVNSGNLSGSNVSSSFNVAVGNNVLVATVDTSGITAVGDFSAGSLQHGSDSVYIGEHAGENLLDASFNILVGANAGTSYVSNESSNIIFNHAGIAGDQNLIRLGSTQTKNFQAGINGVTVTNPPNLVVIDSVNNQLGVMAVPPAPTPLTVGPVSAVSTADALDITSNVLTAHVADNVNAGLLSVVAQNIAGDKTFFGNIIGEQNMTLPASTLTTGAYQLGGSAFMHNFGPAGGCVNVGLATGNIDPSNVSAQYNTAIGDGALASVHTVTHNCAMGTFAASSLTDGTENVFIGYANGENLLTGSSNTIIGAHAGVNYTTNETSNILINHPGVTGDSNVIRIGNGQTETFMTGDVSVPKNLLMPVTTATTGSIYQGINTFLHTFGSNSTYLGVVAGNLTNTGNLNVGVGQGALRAITTGSSNTCVGTNAGEHISTGSTNILIGDEAGTDLLSNETNNILLGHVGVTSHNNEIRIGNPGVPQTSNYQTGIIEGAVVPDANHPQFMLIDPTNDRLATNGLVYRDYFMGGLASQNSGTITAATVNGSGATISGSGFLTGNTIRIIIMGKQVTVIFPAWVVTANTGVANLIVFTALSPPLPLPYNTSASYNLMSENASTPVTTSYATVDALGGLSIQFAATLVVNYGNTAVSSFTYISQ
jgi:hypothetical protein